MSSLYKLFATGLLLCVSTLLFSQTIIKAKIIDATTKEPIEGASIRCADAHCSCGCTTTASGEFQMKCTDCKQLTVSYIGYTPQVISVASPIQLISLFQQPSLMQEVVVSANRGEAVKRAEAPIAIAVLN